MQCIYKLQVIMSASGIVLHGKGRNCQSPNLQEIHCFKW